MAKVRDLIAANVANVPDAPKDRTGYAPLDRLGSAPLLERSAEETSGTQGNPEEVDSSEKPKKKTRVSFEESRANSRRWTDSSIRKDMFRGVVIEGGETNGLGTSEPEAILVQFAAAMFFAREDEGKLTAGVMRIGFLDQPCSVRFRTEGGSAKPGVKYEEKSELIEFAPWEELKTIEIQLIEDDNFDTTLEFRILLEEPKNCILSPNLWRCRTLIIDDDLYPDNKFREQIFHEDPDELHKQGVALLISNLWFCFLRVPTIYRKSILVAALDQLQNAYYLMTIFLRVYLIDVVLNLKDAESKRHLWVKDNRSATAICVALLWTLPHLVLILVERLKVGPLFMDLTIMTHYRVNLLRKYLNYKPESREQVPVGDLVNAMGTDIKDITQKGYLSVFQLFQNAGKLVAVAAFICSKRPTNALPLLVYPVAILLIELQRRTRQLKYETEVDKVQSGIRDVLIHVASRLQLISNYRRRQSVVEEYEKQLALEVPVKTRLRVFEFWANQIIPVLTLLALGSYIALGSVRVIEEETSIGTFLATMNVYIDFGHRFEEMYVCLRTSLQAVEPLVGLVRMMNLETDVGDRMYGNRRNREYVKNFVEELAQKGDRDSDHFDRIPIKLKDIVAQPFEHITTNAELMQGSLVLVTGEHGSGKTTLMRILAGLQIPKSGMVLMPSHLRCINVEYIPELANDLSVYDNLTFGTPDADPNRVLRIVKRLGLSSDLVQILEQDIAALQNPVDDDPGSGCHSPSRSASLKVGEAEIQGWHKRSTAFDRKRVHLGRAFVFNPEILVLVRPVDELDLIQLKSAMRLLREFVQNRGVEMDPRTRWSRRPRTAIFTVGESRATYAGNIVDEVWCTTEEGLQVSEGGQRDVDQVRLPSRSLTGKFEDVAALVMAGGHGESENPDGGTTPTNAMKDL